MPDLATKKFIGISGELVSGKSTAAQFFVENCGAHYLKFSRILDNILDVLDLPHQRKNEQDLGVMLKEQFGSTVLADALLNFAKKTDAPLIIFDGIRKLDELETFRKLSSFKFIFIKSSLENRYQRMRGRHEKTSDTEQSFEEFKASQQHSADQNLAAMEQHADFVVHNDGTAAEYLAQLKELAQKIC